MKEAAPNRGGDLGSSTDADTQRGSAYTVAHALAAAADLIEPTGRWTQGKFRRGQTPDEFCYCVRGAIAHVAPRAPWDIWDAADRAVAETIGLPPGVDASAFLTDWNDAVDRTQAEVVAALRAAAEKARTDSSVGTDDRNAGGSENQ